MSFLDELKKEAEQRRTLTKDSQQHQESQHKTYLATIQPKIKQLHDYLTDLTEQLNFVKPEILVDYHLESFGTISGLRQEDYFLSVDNPVETHLLSLSFACVTDKVIRFDRDNEKTIERIKDYLWSHNLRFEYKESRNMQHRLYRGYFTLNGRISIMMSFSIDMEGVITLTSKNFEGLGVVKYTFQANEINEAFLDGVAKWIVRKPNPFTEAHGKYQVADEARQQLQKQLQEEKRLRQLEIEARELELKKEAELKANRSGLSRLKSFIHQLQKGQDT